MLSSAFSGLSVGRSGCFTCGQPIVRPSMVFPPRCPQPLVIEAAHKKGGGSTKNGRDSNPKMRGVKVYGGQPVKAGGIIVRQVGTKFHPADGVDMGKDFTIYSLIDGIVVFKKNKYIKKICVVPRDQYVIPEGQRVQEGSRQMRRKELYKPRALLAEQAEVAVGAV